VISWIDTALWGCTVAACTSADGSVARERDLKTPEPSCVSRVTNPFFISVAHSLSDAVGHVVAPELPSQGGRTPSRGTGDGTGAPLSGSQSPEPYDM
jgi:hypothetical protein